MDEEIESYCCCLPCLADFREELLNLKNQPIEVFFRSQWHTSDQSLTWLAYRWILAIYFTWAVALSMIVLYSDGIWFIYLTNWGMLMCCGVMVYSAILQSIYLSSPEAFSVDSKAIKFYWAFHWTAVVLSVFISIMFWLFSQMGKSTYEMARAIDLEEIDNASKHGINSFLMLADQMLVAFPSKLYHVIYPLGVCFVYLIFTFIFYLLGGRDGHGNQAIYPYLDWSSPLMIAMVCVSGVILLFICNLLSYGVFNLRVCFSESIK